MNNLNVLSGIEKKKLKRKRYYVCDKCGYVSIVRDSNCPICYKKGIESKMKQ